MQAIVILSNSRHHMRTLDIEIDCEKTSHVRELKLVMGEWQAGPAVPFTDLCRDDEYVVTTIAYTPELGYADGDSKIKNVTPPEQCQADLEALHNYRKDLKSQQDSS